MKSELEWVVQLPIPCPKCGHETMETVARLKITDAITCEGCRASIDLTSEQWRTFVQKFSDALGEIRPLYNKLR